MRCNPQPHRTVPVRRPRGKIDLIRRGPCRPPVSAASRAGPVSVNSRPGDGSSRAVSGIGDREVPQPNPPSEPDPDSWASQQAEPGDDRNHALHDRTRREVQAGQQAVRKGFVTGILRSNPVEGDEPGRHRFRRTEHVTMLLMTAAPSPGGRCAMTLNKWRPRDRFQLPGTRPGIKLSRAAGG